MTRRLPVSQDPPAREPLRQADGQPRIKVPGLADRVWADTVARWEALNACGRCEAPVAPRDREFCWWCQRYLCYACWDLVGHCGHPEAEAENERCRAVPQP